MQQRERQHMGTSSQHMYMRVVGFLFLFCVGTANAETVEFAEEELATESVLPVFDNSVSVRDRNVITEKRIEIGGFAGFNLNEAFYNPYNVGGYVTYHFNEESAVNLFANYYLEGTSSYADQLKAGEGLGSAANGLDFNRAPATKWLALGSYQFTAYYGKMSISKQSITNLSLFLLAGLGAVGIGDETTFAANIGLGQKFYFTSDLAMRFDLRFIFYQAPNPLSADIRVNQGSSLPSSAFEKMWVFNYLLTLGLVYIIPNS
jgi:outer membrane beta-barrel protein